MTTPTVVSVIVLGCTVMPDGSPSDWLTDRLLTTLQLVTHHQDAASGVSLVAEAPARGHLVMEIICSGAAVRSAVTEASCMNAWLTKELTRAEPPFRLSRTEAHAFTPVHRASSPSSQPYVLEWKSAWATHEHRVSVSIVEESQATDTGENLMYSLRYWKQKGNERPVLLGDDGREESAQSPQPPVTLSLWLITSDFHLVRGATLCRNELSFSFGEQCSTHFVLENDTVFLGSGLLLASGEGDPSLIAALKRGAEQQGWQSTAAAGATNVLVHCLAAPTATLQGDHRVARIAREIMLLPQDVERQRTAQQRNGGVLSKTEHYDEPILMSARGLSTI